MKDVKCIGGKAYIGKLVFARTIKNINYDYDTGEESFEYEERLKAGFIKEKSKYFDGYYLIKFFTGEEVFHWATDLFEKSEEDDLTYLKK